MPEISQWPEDNPPERLCDEITEGMDAYFERFDALMIEACEKGINTLVTFQTYDPLTGYSFTRTKTKGSYHAVYGATSLWVKTQGDPE